MTFNFSISKSFYSETEGTINSSIVKMSAAAKIADALTINIGSNGFILANRTQFYELESAFLESIIAGLSTGSLKEEKLKFESKLKRRKSRG